MSKSELYAWGVRSTDKLLEPLEELANLTENEISIPERLAVIDKIHEVRKLKSQFQASI